MPEDNPRKQLLDALEGGHAHATFDQIVEDFPIARIGERLPGFRHSAWEILEHYRIAQHDILQFSLSADWVSPKWPAGYWPQSPAPSDAGQWNASVQAIRDDNAAFVKLLRDPASKLHEPFPWGDGQTLFREALLILAHGSYHLGQLSQIRQAIEDRK